MMRNGGKMSEMEKGLLPDGKNAEVAKRYLLRKNAEGALSSRNYVRLEGTKYVRIPDVPGRIHILEKPKTGSRLVEYVCDRWYDPEKKQSRKKKVVIGECLLDSEKAMIPNENYGLYFDPRTGEQIVPQEQEERMEPEEAADEPARGQTEEMNGTEPETDDEQSGEPEEPEGTSEPEPETDDEQGGEPEEPEEASGSARGESERQPGNAVKREGADESEQDAEIEEKTETTEGDTGEEKEDAWRENMIRGYIQAKRWSAQRKEEARKRALQTEKDQLTNELYGDRESGAEIRVEESRRRLREIAAEVSTPKSPEEIEAERKAWNRVYAKVLAEENAKNGAKGQGQEMADSTTRTEQTTEGGDRKLQEVREDDHFAQERAAVLGHILRGIAESIRNQAKKHPEGVISEYKARKINNILSEIRERYEGSGYEDLLELIEEPEIITVDGVRMLRGMTYSDAEVLMEHYATITHFIDVKKKQSL